MTIIRRVYFYLLAFTGLLLLAGSVANLGRLLLEVALASDGSGANARYVREEMARWAAGALVGLPVWALHWWWARRAVRASPQERRSVLRRLYLYGVLAGAALVAGGSLQEALSEALDALYRAGSARAFGAVSEVPYVLTAAAVWAYHWRVAIEDRTEIGEAGGAATLRRWYVYGLAFVSLVVLLAGAHDLLAALWRVAASPGAGPLPSLSEGVPSALVGLAGWLLHWRWAPRATGDTALSQDRHSALRSVYLFLALAVAVAATLTAASQLLYYGIARVLGVDRPGGVGGNLLQAAAGPASAAVVYGLAWLYQRRAIQQQAQIAEAPRQAGIRRFYTYLVALLALAALATGVGGMLWTLADVATQTGTVATSSWWRDQAARFATLTLVGLPVWLAHWRSGGADATPEERQALSRRLYTYLALIGGMLALVGSAVAALYLPLTLLLGAPATTSLATDLSHALAVALVATAVVVYHWQVIRADASAAPAGAPLPQEATTRVRLRAADPLALSEGLDLLRERGVVVEVLD